MGRTTLTDRTAWNDCHDRVAFTADALGLAAQDGDQEVGALKDKAEELVTGWRKLDEERLRTQRGIVFAHALVRRRDAQADEVVTKLHNAVLASVNLNRNAKVFRALFPDSLYVTIRPALESQIPLMQDLGLRLAESDVDETIRASHGTALQSAIAKGQEAVLARKEAFARAGGVTGDIESWKDNANAVLLGIEGVLKTIASQRKLDTDWVDAFFPENGKKKVEAKPTNL